MNRNWGYLGTGVGPGDLGGEANDGESGVFFGCWYESRHVCELAAAVTEHNKDETQ